MNRSSAINRAPALACLDWQPAPANSNQGDLAQRCLQLEAELAAVEPVMSAAVLVVTAFRLRDEAGLTDTLRLLTESLAAFEARRAREEG